MFRFVIYWMVVVHGVPVRAQRLITCVLSDEYSSKSVHACLVCVHCCVFLLILHGSGASLALPIESSGEKKVVVREGKRW